MKGTKELVTCKTVIAMIRTEEFATRRTVFAILIVLREVEGTIKLVT